MQKKGMPSGKTDEALFAEQAAGPAEDRHDKALSSSVEAALMQIWQELLHIPVIKPTDDFFDLGGDSLAAIRMLERIGRQFGDELLEPDIIYTASTFNDLSAAVTQALSQQDLKESLA